MAVNPFTCDVYTKGLDWLGRITDPVSIAGSVRFNALGNFEFRIRASDPMAEDILAKGTRIAMAYRGQSLMSGMVRTKSGSLLPNGDLVFQLQDDWRVLVNTIAWVRANGAIAPTDLLATTDNALGQSWLPGGGSDAGPDGTTQGQTGYYLWPDGSAAVGGDLVSTSEAAIRRLIQANLIARLGRPVTVNPDLGRGGDARAAGMLPAVRMSKVSEALQPLLDWSGLRLRMIQSAGGTSIVAEITEPTTWGAPLTVASGIIPEGSWSMAAPTATRAVIGGPGEDVNRVFAEERDATGLEAAYGDIIEVFRDATGANLNWPASLTEAYRVAKYFQLRPEVPALDKAVLAGYLKGAGTRGLSEGVPTTGVQATLSETDTFHFGGSDGIQLGDIVTVKDAAGSVFTDRITEAKFSLTAAGFTVEPILGDKTDDATQSLADAVAKLAAAQRKLSASR